MKAVSMLAACFVLFFANVSSGEPQDLLVQKPDQGIRLGPFPLVEAVRGVPLNLRSSVFLSFEEGTDPKRLVSRVIVDLSDLQRKVGTLIDTIPLPTDNCASFAVDNLVPQIWGKRVTIDGDVATLRLNGDLDIWQCIKNPIPCTKIEWDGIVPRIETFDCNEPVKNKINQPFDAEIALRLGVSSSNTVTVVPGDPQLHLGGAGGSITQQLLQIVGVDIQALLKEALDGAISPESLKAPLPVALQRLHPTFTRAMFFDNNGSLAASLEMTATLDADILPGLIGLFVGAQGNP